MALPYTKTGLEAVASGLGQFQNGLTGNVAVMDQEARPKLELFGFGIRARETIVLSAPTMGYRARRRGPVPPRRPRRLLIRRG